MAATGFVPPPYPHDRLGELRAAAEAVPGGIVDCSVGTPVDPMPEVALRALAEAGAGATGYPAAIGALAYRDAAAAWVRRRFGVQVAPDAVVACVGTKELVASLPRVLALRDPSRDTVLYADITYDASGAPGPPATVLAGGLDRALAVHSLSKRSNMAGLRAGFVAGDPALVSYLGEVRKHAGLMTPAPVQAAATAALGDDAHVDEQRARYARRRADALEALRPWALVHDGGPSTFYLWLRAAEAGEDGWSIARRLAERGLLAAPGDLYGPGGAAHGRLSLTQPDERLALAFDRLAAKEPV